VRVLWCSRKGPRVGDGHGEVEEGEADFRERCGYVSHGRNRYSREVERISSEKS